MDYAHHISQIRRPKSLTVYLSPPEGSARYTTRANNVYMSHSSSITITNGIPPHSSLIPQIQAVLLARLEGTGSDQFMVHRTNTHHFILICDSASLRDRVLQRSPFKSENFEFSVQPWTVDRPDYDPWYETHVSLRNVPLHARNAHALKSLASRFGYPVEIGPLFPPEGDLRKVDMYVNGAHATKIPPTVSAFVGLYYIENVEVRVEGDSKQIVYFEEVND